MTYYEVERDLEYSDKNIFDLICDIEKYPEFLPWCKNSNIYNKKDNEFYSDITVGFNLVNETFTSKVIVDYPQRVISTATSGPFQTMINKWSIKPLGKKKCHVSLKIEYEFKSIILKNLIGKFFEQATEKMITAFEKRAKYIYG